MNALPTIWYDHCILTDNAMRSPYRGFFALTWIGWPPLGVSFLHSITKHEDAR